MHPLIAPAAPIHRAPLRTIIRACGLDANLALCLDAADIASWPGSGTKWLDTSGNGADFWRGGDSSSSADPAFSGTAGANDGACWWGVSASAYFKYDASAETWMNNIAKIGGQFTALYAVEVVNDADDSVIWSTAGNVYTEYGGSFTRYAADGPLPGGAYLEILTSTGGNLFPAESLDGAGVFVGAFGYRVADADDGLQASTYGPNGLNTISAVSDDDAFTSNNPTNATMVIGETADITFGSDPMNIAALAFWSTQRLNAELAGLLAIYQARFAPYM